MQLLDATTDQGAFLYTPPDRLTGGIGFDAFEEVDRGVLCDGIGEEEDAEDEEDPSF